MGHARGWLEWFGWTFLGVFLYMMGFLLPLVGFIFFLMAPFPSLVLTVRRGSMKSAFSIGVGALLTAVIFNPFAAFLYLINVGFLGWGLGMLLKKNKEGTEFLMTGIVFALLCHLLVLFVVAKATGINPFNPDLAEVQTVLQPLLEKGQFGQAKAELEEVLKLVSFYMPMLLILYITAEVFLLSIAASFSLKKMGDKPLFSLPPFGEWCFPKNIVVALLVGMLLAFWGTQNPEYVFVRQSGENLKEIIRVLFLIQGLAVVWYYAEIRSVPRFLRVLFVALTPVVFFLSYTVSMVGMLDIWLDIRSRIRGKQT